MNASQREEKKKAVKEAENDANRRRQAATNLGNVPRTFSSRPAKTPASNQPIARATVPASANGSSFPPPSPNGIQHEIPPQVPAYDYAAVPVPIQSAMAAAAMMAPPMNPYFLAHPGFYQASHRAARYPPAMADMQQIASTFNNFDYLAVTRNASLEMSMQQHKILNLLENGFKGSVEELLESVQ